MQNSLMIPNLGPWLDRTTRVRLNRAPSVSLADAMAREQDEVARARAQEKERETAAATSQLQEAAPKRPKPTQKPSDGPVRPPARIATFEPIEEHVSAERRATLAPASSLGGKASSGAPSPLAQPAISTRESEASYEGAEMPPGMRKMQTSSTMHGGGDVMPRDFQGGEDAEKASLYGDEKTRSSVGASSKRDVPRVGEYMIVSTELAGWEDWTDDERRALDDYVRHLMHSRREKAKRMWRGFLQFNSRPMGLFVTIWGTLLTFWGAAWVLFLIGWINVGDKQVSIVCHADVSEPGLTWRVQDYLVEICDQILVALFCLVGIGLAPFRAVDTYHTYFIAHYHRKMLKLYEQLEVASIGDENDLPLTRPADRRRATSVSTADGHSVRSVPRLGRARDPTDRAEEEQIDHLTGQPRANSEFNRMEYHVLSPEQERKFFYHQHKLAASHTFYRPHETLTHRVRSVCGSLLSQKLTLGAAGFSPQTSHCCHCDP